ncbi:phage tail tube protein [Streptomyces sp. NPDC015532]|uniref:phage tail tube protein n=1 Tax=Streptomyces sp. NPDC015532 TaxID=3364960 RepID=UPI003701813A
MASRPIDARGWIFEVRDAEATTETWLPIGLLTSWNRNESENEETADTTTNDSEGYYSQDVMQRGATIEVEGLYAQVTSGTPDPGQAYIDNEWAYRLGADSQNEIRWRHKTQSVWVIWDATVTPGEQSGGTNDKTSWGATFTRCGKPRTAPVAGGGTT